MKNKKLIDGLRQCEDRAAVDKVFEKYKVHDVKERLGFLHKAMYEPQTFRSAEIDEPDARYHREVSVLLTGVWKNIPIYERAGL